MKCLLFSLCILISSACVAQSELSSILLNDSSVFSPKLIHSDSILRFDLRDTSMRSFLYNKPEISTTKLLLLNSIVANERKEISFGRGFDIVYLLEKLNFNDRDFFVFYYHFNIFSGCIVLSDLSETYVVISSFGEKVTRIGEIDSNGILKRKSFVYDPNTLEASECFQEKFNLLNMSFKETTTLDKCDPFGSIAVPMTRYYNRFNVRTIRHESGKQLILKKSN